MATTMTSKINASVEATLTKEGALGNDQAITEKISDAISLSTGTSDDQADLTYHKKSSIALSSDEDFDLAGSLKNDFGDAVVFAKIRALIVHNRSDDESSAAELVVGGGDGGDGTNAWDTWVTANGADGSEAVRLPAGATMVIVAPKTGWSVTATTGDILRLSNASGSEACYYELKIIGCSA